MFWKKDKPMADNAEARPLRSMSITARLSLLFTISGIAMLLLVSVLHYWILILDMHVKDNAALVEKTRRLLKALNKYNIEALHRELSDSTEFHSLVFKFRILDEQGNALLQSPGMQESVPKSAFPAPRNALGELTGGEIWKAHDGKLYLLAAIRTEVRTPFPQKAIFQTAYDITESYRTLSGTIRKIGAIFIFGIPIFWGLGYAITKRGLRPLTEMADRVKKVTATHLDGRINKSNWPKELRSFGTSFDEMLDRLGDSISRLSNFSSDLAHELRTPINNMMGEAEVALSKARTPEEYRKILESYLEECGKLSRLTANLLFLARVENPETCIERSFFDVSDDLNTICAYYNEMAQEQGIELTCSGKGFLAADRALLRQALGNLLSNALCYTPSGGKVEVQTRQPDDHSLEIMVRDTGSGISPEHLPYLFNRFYRGERRRFVHTNGSGLGLSIVKSIMDLHSGAVSIQSEPGDGTTVTLRFPFHPHNSREYLTKTKGFT